jgi:hypothetical protein
VKASGGNTDFTGCDGFKSSSPSSDISTLPVRFARSPANCRSVVVTAQGSSISSSWCSWVSPTPLTGVMVMGKHCAQRLRCGLPHQSAQRIAGRAGQKGI